MSKTEVVRQRAIALVQTTFGSLVDLDEDVAKVVWVTTYRACEMGFFVEQNGGPQALLKNRLIGDGNLTLELEHSILSLGFLRQMIPLIRRATSKEEKNDGAGLLIDCLKWGIDDAAELSGAQRTVARATANADPLYHEELPKEILIGSNRL